MVLRLALLAQVGLVFPVLAVGQPKALVVLPGLALVAHDHLAATDLALVAAHTAVDGVLLVFLVFLILRLDRLGSGCARG